MKLSSAVILPMAVIGLCTASVIAHRQERQVFSSSRFSSSGLVFPGPPANAPVRQQQRATDRSDAPNAEPLASPRSPQPVQVRRTRPQNLPQVPLSMIGQQPEEFIAAAQQRQLQQQRAQQAAALAAQPAPKQNNDDEDEGFGSSETPDEFLPRPPPVRPQHRQDVERPVPRPQQREEPERPIPRPQFREEPERPISRPQQREEQPRIRPRPAQAPQQETQRPEPSIQQAVQQRRPNYPPNYKPRPQEANVIEEERRRPNEAQEEPEGLLEDEEEEVKPDKLQLLLLKTDFNCADKKDGYYADEAVDCEIFHYCQDRVRHSWLCPEGASFHQVHLICMPISKENICKKSSQFHFVNDYLYKPLQDEDGNNSTLYADRYYPEGYEPGYDMADADVPEKPKFQVYNRRQQTSAEVDGGRRRQPINRERVGNENPRKNIEARRPPFSVPNSDDEEPYYSQPNLRGDNRRVSFRRPIPVEDDYEEEED